jgi:hypothetical protein
MYQSKTTVISIGCVPYTEQAGRCSVGSMQSAELAVAVKIASLCHMDIMSIGHQPEGSTERGSTTVVYVNNGISPQNILETMRPEFSNNPSSYWMILDIELWQGLLNCAVTARGMDEEW